MAYKVIRFFYDLQDSAHLYNVGDSYPRDGIAVPDKRIAELLGSKNRLKEPLIEEVKEVKAKRTKKGA